MILHRLSYKGKVGAEDVGAKLRVQCTEELFALLLTSASSVNTFLKALEDKEMITRDGNKWIVYDVFFSRWLEYNYKK